LLRVGHVNKLAAIEASQGSGGDSGAPRAGAEKRTSAR